MIQPCRTPSLTGCTYIYIFIYFASHPFDYHECVNESVISRGIVNRSNSNAPLTQMVNTFASAVPSPTHSGRADFCSEMIASSIIAHFVNANMSMYLREDFALTGILAPVMGVGAPGPVLERSSHLSHRKTPGLDMALAIGISSPELSIVGRLGGLFIGTNRITVMTPPVASMMNVSSSFKASAFSKIEFLMYHTACRGGNPRRTISRRSAAPTSSSMCLSPPRTGELFGRGSTKSVEGVSLEATSSVSS